VRLRRDGKVAANGHKILLPPKRGTGGQKEQKRRGEGGGTRNEKRARNRTGGRLLSPGVRFGLLRGKAGRGQPSTHTAGKEEINQAGTMTKVGMKGAKREMHMGREKQKRNGGAAARDKKHRAHVLGVGPS